MIFREGDELEAEIIGEIPEELGGGWILCFPDGTRLILEKKYYNDYPLTVGQHLNGRIDKINCAGKVYFEPQHPCYSVGQEYSFSVTSIKKLDDKTFQIIVNDCFGRTVEVPSDIPFDMGTIVRLKVRNIRKGKVFLEFPHKPIDSVQYKTLTIVGVGNVEGIKCYLLEDQGSNVFHLPVKWYQHHGLKVGQQVECRIWFSESQNAWRVEPKHPCYTENQTIKVNILKRRSGYYAQDCFGKWIKIHGIDPNESYPQTVICRVLRIRKGRPVLMYESDSD